MTSSLLSRKSHWQLLPLTVLVVLSTGCTMYPYDQMHVHSNRVTFVGFTLKLNERITVEAQRGRGRPISDQWETVGEFTTFTDPENPIIGFNGLRYYMYYAQVEIPDHCWDEIGDDWVTSVRCVDSSGNVLYTMRKTGYDAYLDDEINETTNPLDAWLEHGSRKEYITVWKHYRH